MALRGLRVYGWPYKPRGSTHAAIAGSITSGLMTRILGCWIGLVGKSCCSGTLPFSVASRLHSHPIFPVEGRIRISRYH